MKVNRVSRKGMKLTFFTKEETEQLTLAIESKSYKNNHRIAEAFADKFNKPVRNVYAKVQRIVNSKILASVVAKHVVKETPVAKIEVIEKKVKPLTLPEGMTYQGKAKKVELHADHFRVYF